MCRIITVQFRLDRNGQLVPAIHLRVTCQAGHQRVCPVFIPLCNQVCLIPKRRTRPDDAHLPGQNIEQLRQFIQTGSPQKAPAARDHRLRVLQQMRGHIMRRIGIHGTKFKNAEQTLVAAHPFLAEKTGPLESSLTHAANTNSSGESTMVPASASKNPTHVSQRFYTSAALLSRSYFPHDGTSAPDRSAPAPGCRCCCCKRSA